MKTIANIRSSVKITFNATPISIKFVFCIAAGKFNEDRVATDEKDLIGPHHVC
jgi:hypothetical protein